MVRVGAIRVHLPKSSHPLSNFAVGKKVVLYIFLECHLGARKKAYRDLRLSDCGETTGDRVIELRRYQAIADLRPPGFNELQTVVTHGSTPLFINEPRLVRAFKHDRSSGLRLHSPAKSEELDAVAAFRAFLKG